jgi:hypothetical protein
MGGPGSGRWYRWDKKTTEEEVQRIDIRYLRKQGLLKSKGTCTLTWACRGQETGSINFRVEENRLILVYRARSDGGDWKSIEEPVHFDWTPCHYGGERLWFLCPDCEHRVAVLYSAGIRFLCRKCSRLPYACQNETLQDRMIRKSRKIRRRLGASESLFDAIYTRPKGMHRRTFQRLRAEAQATEDISWAETRRLIPNLGDL